MTRSLIIACLLSVLGATPGVAQTADWPSERPPLPLPAHEVVFPPYEIRTLANGLQVIAVLQHEQPAVTMRMLVRAGSAQDPEERPGLAFLTASLLDQGTTTRTAQQIAEQIDSIGGALGTGSGADLSSVNAIVMKDSFGFGMNLLADVLRHPAFATEEIDRQKDQALSSLRVNRTDPDYVASVVFDRLVYGSHRYGLPGTGTPESLGAITRQDLQTFHHAYFVPNNMILAIVGDVTSQEAFAMAEQVFGGWPRGVVPPVRNPEPPPPTHRVIVIDKPDAVQTEIRVGQLAIPRKHPDFMAWDLAVKILGGEGANRLQQVLRSERGLTYGASADTEAMKQAGDVIAETDTRTETTGEALRLMIGEFARLPRERVADRELAAAQAYLSGSFPLTIETPNDIATQVLNAVFYDLPMTEISTFRERVLAVSPDDIQRVAREYLHPDRLSIVLVGNAKGFTSQLPAAGFPDFEVVPIEQLDLAAPTLRRQAPKDAGRTAGARVRAARPRADLKVRPYDEHTFAATHASSMGRTGYAERAATAIDPALMLAGYVAADAAGDAAGDALLTQVIDAKGGLAALKAIRTIVAETNTQLLMQQETVPSTTRTFVVYPDKFRIDASVGGAEIVQVYNAGQAWAKDPRGTYDVPAAMRDDFAASVARDTIPLLIAAAEGRFSVTRQPDRVGPDGQTQRILEIAGAPLGSLTLAIDARGLIASQSFTTPGPDGRPVRTEELFSDYRVVNGVRVPFETQLVRDGRPVMKRTITSLTFNTPVNPSLFDRPR